MSSIPPRLVKHTLVATVLLVSCVLAPVVLLCRSSLGGVGVGFGLILLAVGCASLVGAVITRCIDRTACSVWQWRLILAGTWIFNPVLVALLGVLNGNAVAAASSTPAPTHGVMVEDGNYSWAWWSGLPLAGALALLSGRLRLVDGDPDWEQEGCPPRPSLCAQWIFSRLVFVALPMCLLSFQVCLYLPAQRMEPQGPEVGLFVCGGCVLISAKFCAMCACLARQKIAQALVLVVLLSADWISSLHLMGIVDDSAKVPLLLTCLLVAGVVQLRAALARLCLRPRWSRALARRRADARDVGAAVDVELGANMNPGASASSASGAAMESSDSEDERGPGSLPDGFYEALVCVIGVPPAQAAGARRQYLCGLRSAVVSPPSHRAVNAAVADASAQPSTTENPVADSSALADPTPAPSPPPASFSTGISASFSTESSGGSVASSAGAAPPAFQIDPADRVCTVCQDEITTGDHVRPLPKCSHIFHATCLERWAKTMRESTRCPTCRRPALARRSGEGSISIQVLTACGDDSDNSSSSSSRRESRTARTSQGRGGSSGRTRASGRREGRPGGARPARPPGRPASDNARSGLATQLRASLGVSEALARAALECSGGAPDVAAHILLEHKTLLEAAFGIGAARSAVAAAAVPAGVVEAFVESNPELAGLEANLRRQLGSLYRSGRMSAVPWADLQPEGRLEVFQHALEDVVRRLDDRVSR